MNLSYDLEWYVADCFGPTLACYLYAVVMLVTDDTTEVGSAWENLVEASPEPCFNG